MDPNANLARQLVLAQRIIERDEQGEPDPGHDARELAELVQALDAWINAGGFLPKAWEP